MILSRFAPAPTGFLHLGHVLSAIHVWGVAHLWGGRVLLRIEDHDRIRSRPEFERAILEDLEWLGFRADEPMTRQSERGEIYREALETLREQGLVYACACSRADIERSAETARRSAAARSELVRAKAEAFQASGDELRYPGTCRDRGLAESGNGLRIRLAPSTERFVDLRHGPQEQRPYEQCGDLLARDRDGNWTYQFAATVDDLVQGVTLVIRGDDLRASTGRQIQLARLLGRGEPAEFLHHALITKSPGQKLSKSDGGTGVRELRERGWSPARVVGQAAALAGLIPDARDLPASDVSSMMDAFKGVPR